jgi:diaminohydroxyphosphoribosylaminopyrimidine deaminase / 5-amino-6-(5-phosphoribosylamino)uracil reductase
MAMQVSFMHRCLALAEQGRGAVGNGALVGAVLVRDGQIIAEGFHKVFGSSHAERDLLERFNNPIAPDDILYVNLEPCCHHGKTPPCADIIVERGIKHVIYGMQDPDPRVAGQGIAALRSAGATVAGSVELPLCERLNRGFISVREKDRPFITLKKALTHDGRLAHEDGSPMKITSDTQDIWTHTHLRAEHDAILVGVQTVIADNPRLDARLDSHKRDLHPWRIILDRTLHIPLESRVVTDDYRERTMIVHAPIVTQEMEFSAARLRENGVRLIEVPITGDTFDWSVLWQLLVAPDQKYHGITSVLVEGGAKTWDIFKKAKMIDEEVILIGDE